MQKILRESYLYLNNYCNLDCSFCASDYTTKSKYNCIIALEDLDEFFRINSKNSFRLVISGGEPTLVPNLIDVITLAKHYYKEIAIQTNAILLSDDNFIYKIIDAGITTFAVPFYSDNTITYSYLTNSKNKFDKYVQGLKNLSFFNKTNKIKFLLKVLPLTNNLDEIIRLNQFLICNSISVKHLFYHGIHNSKKLLASKSLVPAYKLAGDAISMSIDNLDEFYSQLSVVEFPLCFLSDSAIEKLVDSGLKYQAKTISSKVYTYNGRTHLHKKSTFQFPNCNRCFLFNYCDGINNKNIDHNSNIIAKQLIPFIE